MRKTSLIFLLFCLIAAAARPGEGQSRPRTIEKAAAEAQKIEWKVDWEPSKPVNGAPLLLRVTANDELRSLKGRWLEKDLFFDFDPASQTWFSATGVRLETTAGKYELELEGATKSGKTISHRQTITVGAAVYRTTTLRVASRYTDPDPQTLKRIKEEQALKAQIFARVTPQRLWRGPFAAPVASVITDVFGTRRTFNGEVRSVHQGIDYRASTGTPIAAMNSGQVILARNLFFEGNCVVIDHGQGWLTLYLHFSQLQVSEGTRVKRGQVIGLSGATGRVTGPHLHVAARWQGQYLNPEKLLELPLPEGAP
jgi:murein DD-endopeptidase MepM/ murein hydrolase activator NlpD